MLLKLARELSGRNIRYVFVFWFIFITALFTVGIGYFIPKYFEADSFTTMRYGFIFINLVYSVAGVAWLFFLRKRKTVLRKTDMRNIAGGLLLIMFLQNAVLLVYDGNIYVAMVCILLFFVGGAFIPVYIRYKSDLSVLLAKTDNMLTFEELCRNFDISSREKDIVREICHGLSNQQIADKLFISLQTVKDHTSRIYDKTNCSSRAQLIAMVKNLI